MTGWCEGWTGTALPPAERSPADSVKGRADFANKDGYGTFNRFNFRRQYCGSSVRDPVPFDPFLDRKFCNSL